MPVQNLECQIHVVLMKRFLDGDELGPELQNQLEQHLKVCPSCRAILENEKTSIEEVLDGPATPTNPVMAWMQNVMPGSKTRSGYAVTDAHSALMAPTTVHRPAPGMAAFKNPQVLMLSAALAVVLILMSTVFRDPTRFLGPKATTRATAAAATEVEKQAEGQGKSEATKAEATKAEATMDEATMGEDAKAEAGQAKDEASSLSEKPADTVDPEPRPEPGTESDRGGEDQAEGERGTNSESPAETKPAAQESQNEAPKPAAKPISTTRPDGTVVPGERTLDKSEITVVGGSSARATAARASTQTQPATRPSSARRSTSNAAPRRRAEATRRTNSQRRPAARPTTSRPSQPATPRGSGVVVYDKNGNRLN